MKKHKLFSGKWNTQTMEKRDFNKEAATWDEKPALSRSNFIPHPGAGFIPHFFWVKF
jgi:hypothetical protein